MDNWEVISHPLYGPYRKVGRAKEQFDALSREVEAFTDSEPYHWWTEVEDCADDVREYTVFAEVLKEPDISWGLDMGDVLHNLRASIDHLVWAISDPEIRDTNTAFPIELSEAKWDANAPHRIAGVKGAARALIQRTQPYHWREGATEHPLAILKQLSNLDKHRTLLPVALARRHEYVAGYGEFRVKGFTYLATGPIEDGAEVMRFFTQGEPSDQVNMNAYLSFEVTFEGRPLRDIESIFRCIGYEILDAFDRS